MAPKTPARNAQERPPAAFGRPRRAGATALVFCLVFVVYLANPTVTSFDSRWTVHTALSILHEGNTDLNEYADLVERNPVKCLLV